MGAGDRAAASFAVFEGNLDFTGGELALDACTADARKAAALAAAVAGGKMLTGMDDGMTGKIPAASSAGVAALELGLSPPLCCRALCRPPAAGAPWLAPGTIRADVYPEEGTKGQPGSKAELLLAKYAGSCAKTAEAAWMGKAGIETPLLAEPGALFSPMAVIVLARAPLLPLALAALDADASSGLSFVAGRGTLPTLARLVSAGDFFGLSLAFDAASAIAKRLAW